MANIQASSLSVGTSVYLKYSGNYEEFLVIHQGNPNSSIYDSSCNGTWLWKKISSNTSFSLNNPNYSQSNLRTQETSSFNLFGQQEQQIIKTIKIPWYDLNGNLYTGSSGLESKVFTLSIVEIFEDAESSLGDGVCLNYFKNFLNIGEGQTICWSRTIDASDGRYYYYVYFDNDGALTPSVLKYDSVCYYQPTIIIPSTTLFDSSTMRLATNSSGNDNTSSSTSYKVGQVLNYDYTGSVQTVTLPAGTYKLECWGAQGGYRSSSTYGGKGGYSYGTINLPAPTTVYLYAGGFPGNTNSSAGTTTTRAGGFNGGGKRHGYYGGGGGSDIRIGQDSLYARVIVAGGGGSDGATSKTGMYGGGSSGGSSTQNFGTGGGGGTQTAGGAGGSNNSGSFGQGGQGLYRSNGYAGAGGGGWYGGGGSSPDGSGDDDRGGGGGSGYVYTSSTASQYPSGCLLNASYYLTDANTIAGNSSFTDYSGSQVIGHSGHGACRITILKLKSASPIIKIDSSTWNENTEMFIKIDSNTWASVDAIYIKTENGWMEGG